MGAIQDQMVMTMQLRNLSAKTISTYLWQVKSFVRMNGKSPAEMGEEEVEKYLYSLVERKVSWSMVRIAYSALKFLYKDTLKREWKVQKFHCVKREKRLPVVLSGEEIKRLFEAVKNLKHRMVLMSCYSAGLRISEAVHLKANDIDSQRMQIRVEQGKGKKDRYTLLSTTLLEELRRYWKLYHPHEWLFAGRIPGKALTVSGVQRTFVQAKKKLGSPRMYLFIRCATALLLTFWSRAPIYLLSNSCWVIQV
jgi:site-specific recombinase XerD